SLINRGAAQHFNIRQLVQLLDCPQQVIAPISQIRAHSNISDMLRAAHAGDRLLVTSVTTPSKLALNGGFGFVTRTVVSITLVYCASTVCAIRSVNASMSFSGSPSTIACTV